MERRNIWDCVTVIEREGLEGCKISHIMAKMLLEACVVKCKTRDRT